MAEIGSILGGRYRLIELLGQGGMATIFRALDTQLGRDVAVKLLRPEYLRDPDFGSRFRQEAQNAASLSHPNVVTVYDYGEDPSGPYIVMEFVDGEDLATILRRNGSLPPAQAARIAAAVARALEAAHARGIVHRDVKPGNVLIGRDGRVKVVDFGIARAIAEAQMTLPGTTLGSVHYFSPEQARGEPTTAASDIYALGIVLFEMLTGSRPWEGDSAASVALARLSGPTPDPALLRPSLPTDVAAITRKALALAPADRFASAGAMADALERTIPPATGAAAGAAAGVGAAARPGSESPPPVSPGPTRPSSPIRPMPMRASTTKPRPRAHRHRRRSRTRATALAPWSGSPALSPSGSWSRSPSSSSSCSPAPAARTSRPTWPCRTSWARRCKPRPWRPTASASRSSRRQETSDQPVGTILRQDPPEGSVVAEGDTVNVVVAAGVETVPVPDLRNQTEAQAVATLLQAELAVGAKSEAFDPTVALGLVFTQSHQPGSIVAKGTPIDYVVSKGPEPTPDPDAHADPDPDAHPDADPDRGADADADEAPTPTPTEAPTPTPTEVPTEAPTPDALTRARSGLQVAPEVPARFAGSRGGRRCGRGDIESVARPVVARRSRRGVVRVASGRGDLRRGATDLRRTPGVRRVRCRVLVRRPRSSGRGRPRAPPAWLPSTPGSRRRRAAARRRSRPQ